MTDRESAFWSFDATICVSTSKTNQPRDQRRRSWGPGFTSPDWETFNRLMDLLQAHGFRAGRDPEVAARYPSLAGTHYAGETDTPHGALRFVADTYPTGCKIEFFQDVNISNQNGGRYDFDRLAKMPYLIRKKFERVQASIMAHLAGRGFRCRDKIPTPVPLSTIGERLGLTEGVGYRPSAFAVVWGARLYFNQSWNMGYEGAGRPHRFTRDLFGWPTRAEISCFYARGDADRVPISHGEVRYFRTSNGRLSRGVVFGGINDRWLIVTGPGARDFTHRSGHELFVYNPGHHPRKAHPKPTPALIAIGRKLGAAVAAEDFETAIKLRETRHRLISRAAPAAKAA